MAVRLITGPAGSGKTGRALRIFKQFSTMEHEQSVRFLVPTVSQCDGLRRLLLSDHKFPGFLGDPVCTFFRFAGDVLADARVPRRRLISDVQKRLILQEIVQNSAEGFFAGVMDSPNFTEALGSAIDALKLAAATPEDLLSAAKSAKGLSQSSLQKIRDFASLYAGYQEELVRHNLHDREGLMWRAFLAAQGQASLLDKYKLVVLDGFLGLTPVQKGFIKLLAERCENLVITLDWEEGRPQVFSGVEQDFNFLMGLPGVCREHLPRYPERQGISLGHMEQYLFCKNAKKQEPDGRIITLAGADPDSEVELVAQTILKLVRKEGYEYGDFGIVTRGADSYRRRIKSVFKRSFIPFSEGKRPLAESPLARALVLSLKVVEEGWQREHVLPLLKSGYLSLDMESCIKIETACAGGGRKAGRDAWFSPWRPHDPSLDDRKSALASVLEFERALKFADWDGGLAAVERLFGSFNLHREESLLCLDYAAWKSIREIMRGIIGSQKLLQKNPAPGEFVRLLEMGILSGRYSLPGGGQEGVQLLKANALAGKKFPVIFILGLLEKVFPRQMSEDPFLLDAERAALNLHLPNPLPIRSAMQDGERLLFYTAAASAGERLYLCYPALDASAKDSLPSFYLHDVNSLFHGGIPKVAVTPKDVAPPPEEAETLHSLAMGVALAASEDGAAQSNDQVAAAIYNRLLDAGCFGGGEFEWLDDRRSGISDKAIISFLHERAPVFRVTALESYVACPFRYFCEQELRLDDARDEPGALERGSIAHKVLCRLYTALFQDGNDGHSHQGAAKLLDVYLDDCIESEPLVSSMPVYQKDIERRTLRGMLHRFLFADLANAGESPFAPGFFELEFGVRAENLRERSPKSSQERLKIPISDGLCAELVGKIDRVDLSKDGRALVVDYKTGDCPDIKGVDNGTLLQAPLYALAIENIFGLKPAGAEYRSLRKLDTAGFYTDTDSIEDFRTKIQTAISAARESVLGIKSAQFPLNPNRNCRGFCSFGSICRVDDRVRSEAG